MDRHSTSHFQKARRPSGDRWNLAALAVAALLLVSAGAALIQYEDEKARTGHFISELAPTR